MISSAKLNMFLFIHEEHKRIIQVDNTYPLLLPSISSGQLHKHRIITKVISLSIKICTY